MNGEETNLVRRIMLKIGSLPGTRIFRNNVGTGWIGSATRFSYTQQVTANSGDVLIRSARPLIAGLCKGSSDTIGFRSVEITPEMVGKRVAIFVAIEAKTKNGKPSPEQTAFINIVNINGGIAFIAKDENEAFDFLTRG